MSQLTRHLKRHHNEKVYQCTGGCTSKFATMWELKQHMYTHSEIREFKCPIESCNASFKTRSSLWSHTKSHSLDRPFLCHFEGCLATFKTAEHRNRHVRRIHSDQPPPIACDYDGCNYACWNQHELERHKKRHTGQRMHKCIYVDCGLSFKTKDDLKQHQLRHLNTKSFICGHTGCEASFFTSSELTRHKRIHSGERRHRCLQPRCTKAFKTSAELTQHLKSHSDERPYRCVFEECGKAFKTLTHLNRHKFVHIKEKPFNCGQVGCAFSCSTHSDLKRHEKTHTDIRDYVCPDCDKTFRTHCDLKRHMLVHETNYRWTHVCTFADFSTEKAHDGNFPCARRFPSSYSLDAHIQKCHTEQGLLKRLQSEQQLANFLDKVGIIYRRDYQNVIHFGHCPQLELPGRNCRPDFYLTDLSVRLNTIVLLGNDEYAHRSYPTECEFARMLKITAALFANPEMSSRLIYIRFNPHFYTINGVLFDPPLTERYKRLKTLLDNLDEENSASLLVIYMFYDTTYGELDIFKDVESEAARTIRNCHIHYE